MWTDWTCEVSVWVEDPTILTDATACVREVMREVEMAASRFRNDSEVMALTDGAVHSVSHVLSTMVSCALAASAATDGAIDPTLGAVLQSWGYRDAVPSAAVATPVVSVSRRASWRDVSLDVEAHTLTVPVGVLIDLGATAKAWAADRAANLISDELGSACVVGIGGDLAIRCEPNRRLPVNVAESDTSSSVQVLVGSGGLATSTTTLRRWATTDSIAHHVIDPATAAPAAGPWRTVTVAAANCAAANHAATAALVKGTAAVNWLEGLGLPARLISQAGDIVYVAQWPTDEGAA